MTQYIDKDVVVAAIKKIKKQYVGHSNFTTVTCTCDIILSLINTLEVKEVDLNKNNLTWEDISAIRHTMARLRRQFSNDNQVVNNEEFCKEVLNCFKAQKGEEVWKK